MTLGNIASKREGRPLNTVLDSFSRDSACRHSVLLATLQHVPFLGNTMMAHQFLGPRRLVTIPNLFNRAGFDFILHFAAGLDFPFLRLVPVTLESLPEWMAELGPLHHASLDSVLGVTLGLGAPFGDMRKADHLLIPWSV